MEKIKTDKNIYTVKSPEQMMRVGEKIGGALSGGDVVLLSGELGAGKTVFCKGLGRALGVKSQVVSPTFTIMNEHKGDSLMFCHFDLYRLESEGEAREAGLTDFIGADNCLCAVEWWENVPELFDGCRTVHVTIEKTDDSTRKVIIIRNESC